MGATTSSENAPSNMLETRRKHRWVFTSIPAFDKPSFLLVLKSAARPQFKFEEPVMHHNQEQVYFAGKQSWEPIDLVWYDAEQPDDVSEAVWKWLGSADKSQSVGIFDEANVRRPDQYKIDAELSMVDGMGDSTEKWTLKGTWPQKVNWEDLAYDNTEIATITVTVRFDRAVRTQGGGGGA